MYVYNSTETEAGNIQRSVAEKGATPCHVAQIGMYFPVKGFPTVHEYLDTAAQIHQLDVKIDAYLAGKSVVEEVCSEGV